MNTLTLFKWTAHAELCSIMLACKMSKCVWINGKKLWSQRTRVDLFDMKLHSCQTLLKLYLLKQYEERKWILRLYHDLYSWSNSLCVWPIDHSKKFRGKILEAPLVDFSWFIFQTYIFCSVPMDIWYYKFKATNDINFIQCKQNVHFFYDYSKPEYFPGCPWAFDIISLMQLLIIPNLNVR